MNNLKDFPDLGRSAKLLKISVELESIPQDNIIGSSIVAELRKKNLKGCLKMIWSMSEDNRNLMEEIIGKKLLEEIESLKP